jgi:digeranylgeranylglycerophospholipid reductase
MKCDVLVVGAGPAGSSAAYACAKAGLETVFIDRKKEVGIPITCSGAVGSYLFGFLPFKVPKRLLEHRIEGLEFIVEDISFVRRGGPWTSYAIDRSAFDLWLSKRAQNAGAELLLETEFTDLKFDSQRRVKKAVLTREGKIKEVEFSVLIGADGAESKVLERLGKRRKGAKLGRAVVYEYKGVNLDSSDMDQLYFGDFAPGGYAHIFPLSEDRANVGVGTIDEKIDINKCFTKLLSHPRVHSQLKGAEQVREKSGRVSFEWLSDRRHYDNVLFAGEAASQNIKPLVEGFLPSIICGDIAGKTAFRHIRDGAPLESYQENLDRVLGPIFNESDKLIELLGDISELKGEKSYLLLAGLTGNIFTPKDVLSLKDSKPDMIKERLGSLKKSKTKQTIRYLTERGVITYLHARRWINSKIYKL